MTIAVLEQTSEAETIKNLLWSPAQRSAHKKTHAFSKNNKLWNQGYSNHRLAGNRMEMIGSIPEDQFSWKAWVSFYLKDREEDLISIARSWARNINVSLEVALNEIFIHYLDEPYLGHLTELKAIELIRHHFPNYVIRHATRQEDKLYKIDLVAINENGDYMRAWQVKAESFWRSENIGFAREKLKKDLEASETKLGIPIMLICKKHIEDNTLKELEWQNLRKYSTTP